MNAEWTTEHLFYRQVNPNWLSNGQPNSQAFGPMPKDKDLLSVDDSALVSATDAWRHFTQKLGFRSVGTWAVSFAEIKEVQDLKVCSSPLVVPEDTSKNNPAHCHVDFSQVSSKSQKKHKAQLLALKASARGCQYAPIS
jgi:hypothetical protein